MWGGGGGAGEGDGTRSLAVVYTLSLFNLRKENHTCLVQ